MRITSCDRAVSSHRRRIGTSPAYAKPHSFIIRLQDDFSAVITRNLLAPILVLALDPEESELCADDCRNATAGLSAGERKDTFRCGLEQPQPLNLEISPHCSCGRAERRWKDS